jgi:hypothetical protein
MRKSELPERRVRCIANKNVAKYREMNSFVLRHRQGFWLYFRRELSQRSPEVQIAKEGHDASYC